MNSIIEVTNLGKKYNIGERQGYVALRDVLANIARSPARWFGGKVKAAIGRDNPSEFWALKDVNFKVEQGEVLGIIGRNGAGKSTLLKILSQITPPTTGEIRLRGRVGSLLEVGTGFHPELSGRENIFLNGSILGMRKKEIEKKFDEIVEFSGIGKFLDTPVKRYSSGMYVRLAFSVAAHLEPDILIVDEVLAVGDAEFQKKCLGKMEDVTKKDGRTVIFVSHNMGAIRSLCSRCVLLDKGQVLYDGEVSKALGAYDGLQSNGCIAVNSGEYNKYRRGSGTVSFTNIQILGADGMEKKTFFIGNKVRFILSYEIFEEMAGLHVNIGFFSSKAIGLLLTDVNYQIDNGIVKKGDKGRVVVEISLDIIRPGEYYLYFWIGDSSAKYQGTPLNYDVVDNMIGPLVILDGNSPDILTTGLFSINSKMIE